MKMRFLLGGSAALLPFVSNAQLVTQDVTDALDAATADITTVGIALIVLAALALAIRWVKATFF